MKKKHHYLMSTVVPRMPEWIQPISFWHQSHVFQLHSTPHGRDVWESKENGSGTQWIMQYFYNKPQEASGGRERRAAP